MDLPLVGFLAGFFMVCAPRTGSPPLVRMRRRCRLRRGSALFMGGAPLFRSFRFPEIRVDPTGKQPAVRCVVTWRAGRSPARGYAAGTQVRPVQKAVFFYAALAVVRARFLVSALHAWKVPAQVALIPVNAANGGAVDIEAWGDGRYPQGDDRGKRPCSSTAMRKFGELHSQAHA